eukprot:4393735-Pyramimonas_sp.AAC.1
MGRFRVDAGSMTILDFPDGAGARAVLRCSNYTAHLGRWAVPVSGEGRLVDLCGVDGCFQNTLEVPMRGACSGRPSTPHAPRWALMPRR